MPYADVEPASETRAATEKLAQSQSVVAAAPSPLRPNAAPADILR